jgi:hypothetical protein
MTTVSKRLLTPQLHRQALIERQEVVALLFNMSDIAITLTSIEWFLKEDEDDGEEEADQS